MNSVQPAPSPRGRCVPIVRAGWVALALALLAGPLHAEVSVVTDARGKYLKTLFLTEARGARRLVWSPVRRGVDPTSLLNANGDRMGDDVPFIRDQPGSRQPWVVWSASDGHDKEIAVATWVGGRWHGPQLLEGIDNLDDDLHPQMAFDGRGRPVVVWWRREPTPRVYLSVYDEGVWSRPLLISDPTVSSRYPSVRVEGMRAIVAFYTPLGQAVLFQDLSNLGAALEGNGPLDGPVPPPDQQSDPPDAPEHRRGGPPGGPEVPLQSPQPWD